MIQPNNDYFSNPAAARYSTSMRPRSPFPGMTEFDHDGVFPSAAYGAPETNQDGLIQLINRYASCYTFSERTLKKVHI